MPPFGLTIFSILLPFVLFCKFYKIRQPGIFFRICFFIFFMKFVPVGVLCLSTKKYKEATFISYFFYLFLDDSEALKP